MIAAIYGVQALVFVMRRKWDMIGWMIFYILALPAFSLFLPLYSFWRMDNFSWGQTRVVLGESGKKMIVHVSSNPKARRFSYGLLISLFVRTRVSLILVLFL